MFDDLSVLVEPEYIHSGIVVAAGPVLEAVKNHEIAFGNGPLYVDVLAGVSARHSLKILDERVLACCHTWIVLNVVLAGIQLYRPTWLTSVEHHFVERSHGRLVGLQILHTTSLETATPASGSL